MNLTRPYVPIPFDQLPQLVGKPVHLSWAKPGAIWLVVKVVSPSEVLLVTPKRFRELRARPQDLRYVRHLQPKGPKS